MKYKDKRNKQVVLTPTKGEYVIKFKIGHDAESLINDLNQSDKLKSAKLVQKDDLSIVAFSKAAEKKKVLNTTLGDLEATDMVEAIIPVFSDEEGFKRLVIPNRLLVAYENGLKEELISNLPEQFKLIEQSNYGNWLIIEIPTDLEMEAALEQLTQLPQVQYCEPVFYGVNDAEEVHTGNLRWNLENINVNEAWEITTGNPEIVVAVIDGKPDINHPAIKTLFQEELPEEWDFSNVQTCSSHSTQIISILASQTAKVQGISPGIRVLPLAVNLEAQYYYQRAEAIHYLKSIQESGLLNDQPVKRVIANCSWKTAGDVGVIREAMAEAAAAGVLFITSAGNEGHSSLHYPSDYSSSIQGCFSVAALAPNDQRAVYSNYSLTVTISAPGGAGLPFDSDDIYCADVNSKYAYTAGTSFAAPHLAGVIALMLSVNPDLTKEQISEILINTAEPIKEQNPDCWQLLGAGKLNAGAAVAAIKKITQIPPDQPTDPVNTVGPEEPTEPGNSDQPITPNDPGELDDPASPDPKSILETDMELFVKEVTARVNSEIKLLAQQWTAGSELRITIESNGASVVFNYIV